MSSRLPLMHIASLFFLIAHEYFLLHVRHTLSHVKAKKKIYISHTHLINREDEASPYQDWSTFENFEF